MHNLGIIELIVILLGGVAVLAGLVLGVLAFFKVGRLEKALKDKEIL